MSLSIISDVETQPGDPNRLLKEINEERASRQSKTTTQTTTQSTQDTNEDAGALDPRFKGKSARDIAEMYRNLESHSGRLANDLGRTQAAVTELMVDKRARDLNANGVRQPVTVDAAELLQRPTEALDPYIEERVNRVLQPVQQQLSRMEAALANTVFASHHSDANDVVNSPEFANWTRETPLRRDLAASAAQGNTNHADMLLTEFKSSKAARIAATKEVGEDGLEQAGKVTLEQTRTGNDGATATTGKIYNRSDIIALQRTNPDAYWDEGFQTELNRAYREKRVR